MDNSRSIDTLLREIGVGRRAVNDPFFDETHEQCKVFLRTGVTVEDDEELCHQVIPEFPCNVFGCKGRFRSLIDFEIHYNGSHRYVCQECKKIRPNARLLEIHIQETHDSFFLVLAEKQPMYQCYVSECETKFVNPAERRSHCIALHKFPKNFRYDNHQGHQKCKNLKSKDSMEVEETNGKKKSNAKKDHEGHQKCKNSKSKDAMVVEETNGDKKSNRIINAINLNKSRGTKMFARNVAHSVCSSPQDLQDTNKSFPVASEENSRAKSVESALAFIPRQVSQRSYSNVLTKDKKMERNVLETETLMDLGESLPE